MWPAHVAGNHNGSGCCGAGRNPFVSAFADDWSLRLFTRKMVSTMSRMRLITPPVTTPMSMEVSVDLLDDGEEIQVGTFPSVDSGRFTDSDAFTILNQSAVTTSKYAHPGTAIHEVIGFGYLSSAVNSCLKLNERSNEGRTWILRSLNYCNLRTSWTT